MRRTNITRFIGQLITKVIKTTYSYHGQRQKYPKQEGRVKQQETTIQEGDEEGKLDGKLPKEVVPNQEGIGNPKI